jgi:DNA-binding GntR family transcriptional regulator
MARQASTAQVALNSVAEGAERPHPASLADVAFDWLASRIMNGTLGPGQPLSELAIVAQVGVSRTPIREALRRLERDGLVKIVPGRGAIVAPVTEREVREIYLCRMNLEALAGRLAAEKATPEALSQFRNLSERLARAKAANDLPLFFRTNVEFTELKWKVADNQVLQQLLESLGLRVMRLRYLSMGLPGRMEASYRLHEEIYKAFERHDGEAAAQITVEIIRGACEAILRYHFGVIDPAIQAAAANHGSAVSAPAAPESVQMIR